MGQPRSGLGACRPSAAMAETFAEWRCGGRGHSCFLSSLWGNVGSARRAVRRVSVDHVCLSTVKWTVTVFSDVSSPRRSTSHVIPSLTKAGK
jgi:hypothetical protein